MCVFCKTTLSERQRVCFVCQLAVHVAIKDLGWEPDYKNSFVKNGMKYIPGKAGKWKIKL